MNYDFLAQVDEAFDGGELRNRIRKILRRMELLSEARAMSLEQSVHGGEPDNLPPGVRKETSIAKPSRKRSLFERYLWEFEQCPKRADPQWAFALLCTCAERDYRHYLQGGGPSAVAGNMHVLSPGQVGSAKEIENFEKEKARELEQYEGAPASLVAEIIQQPVGWVQKAREKLMGCDPETGRPKEDREWDGWSDERRRLEVARLLSKGMAEAEMEGELGVSYRTIRRYKPKREDDRRAA